MLKNKSKMTIVLFFIVLIAITVTFGGWMAYKTDTARPDYYFSVGKNMSVFGKVYEEITKRYVEVIDPEEFMRAGINGMLNTLDPYTLYIEKDGNQELQIMTKGKYGGVGMRISKRDDWATVIEPPFEGTPSARAGIREGDKIIAVDSMSTKDLTITETAHRLRGKPGTEVFVKIRRFGEEDSMEFRLIRAEIKVEEISYAGFVKDRIGYIRLHQFSRDVGNQVNDAISDLKKQGMESLILDLRGNPGGLLESAVAVADNFLPKGELVVSRKGRTKDSNEEYRANKAAIWPDGPVVVLVDTFSASASEIVAGAIQDLDRGLVIGSPTFGKGLVQQVVPISSESALKITTSKYYIPSGRLIQKSDVFTGSKVLMTNSEVDWDSTKTFKTSSGREVKGNGGITPDIRITRKKIPMIVRQMIMKSMFFNFSIEYAASHEHSLETFEIDDAIITEYKAFLKSKNFKYRTETEEEIRDLEKVLDEAGYKDRVNSALSELKRVADEEKEKDFDESIDFIKWYLKEEIAAKLWGTSAKTKASFERTPEIQKALEILSDKEIYYSLLHNK